MTIPVLQAARHLGVKSRWTLSNLHLQKMLYLAHMVYLGDHDGEPLVFGRFQAWDYGPVHPDLYHHLKEFGADAVKDYGQFDQYEDLPRRSPERKLLNQVVKAFPYSKDLGPKLVAITHWRRGAWHKFHNPP